MRSLIFFGGDLWKGSKRWGCSIILNPHCQHFACEYKGCSEQQELLHVDYLSYVGITRVYYHVSVSMAVLRLVGVCLYNISMMGIVYWAEED